MGILAPTMVLSRTRQTPDVLQFHREPGLAVKV
jgi:hypothetical protein